MPTSELPRAVGEMRDLLGSRDELAHERLRELALLKLPELEDLIAPSITPAET